MTAHTAGVTGDGVSLRHLEEDRDEVLHRSLCTLGSWEPVTDELAHNVGGDFADEGEAAEGEGDSQPGEDPRKMRGRQSFGTALKRKGGTDRDRLVYSHFLVDYGSDPLPSRPRPRGGGDIKAKSDLPRG